MKKGKISFLRSPAIRNYSRIFLGLSGLLLKMSPYIKISLKQSGVAEEYSIKPREYLAVCFFVSSMFSGSVIVFISGTLMMSGKGTPIIGVIFGGVLFFIMYFYLMMYPKAIVNRRVKYIERNLLFALRTILIQIRSGVPIFNSLASIASGDFGPISDEMKTVIEKVRSGQSVVDALEELAVRNPSAYFRRALWQLVNGLKSGSDVGNNLENIIKSLAKEQLVEISRYKSTLNPLAMMYMMVSVIMPSLGITMLIILASFPGMEAIGNENTFWALLGAVIMLQVVFMGIIKSKRPNLIGT